MLLVASSQQQEQSRYATAVQFVHMTKADVVQPKQVIANGLSRNEKKNAIWTGERPTDVL